LEDSPVDVLIFKEAIALGWDCPRASILFLQREWRHERYTFNIQTLGRIMRMPEQTHYENNPELNVGYVYSSSTNFEIVQELADDYVTSLLMTRDEQISERPITLHSEFIRRKVELRRLSADFKQYVFEAAQELETNTLINPKVTRNDTTIGIDGRIEAIDKAQTVAFDKTLKLRMSDAHVWEEYAKFALDQTFPFMPKGSAKMIKSSIRSWFKANYGMDNEDAIARVVMWGPNRPKFRTLLSSAKEKYQQQPEKSDSVVLNDAWEIPESVSLFKTHYIPLESSKKSILKEAASESFFVKRTANGAVHLSKPELKFIDFLESSDDETQWWFKNGVRDSKYFSIAYRRRDGRLFGFYPDFIIKTKKEILIVEIKDENGFRSSDNLLKLNAGRDYLTKYEQKEKVRFFILSPDDFDDFFLCVRNQELDKFSSSFEQALLTYHKSNQIVLENKADKTDDESLELEILEELDKTIAELEDTKLKNELLELSLQQAEENLVAIGKAIENKKPTNGSAVQIPTPFKICVLGEVSSEEQIMQELQAYFTKNGVGTNDWGIKFFNNTKLQNADVLRSLVKGQSRFNLVLTGQIHHHAGKGNAKSNIISELKNENIFLMLSGPIQKAS
jgi:type III restriction enzyme